MREKLRYTLCGAPFVLLGTFSCISEPPLHPKQGARSEQTSIDAGVLVFSSTDDSIPLSATTGDAAAVSLPDVQGNRRAALGSEESIRARYRPATACLPAATSASPESPCESVAAYSARKRPLGARVRLFGRLSLFPSGDACIMDVDGDHCVSIHSWHDHSPQGCYGKIDVEVEGRIASAKFAPPGLDSDIELEPIDDARVLRVFDRDAGARCDGPR